VEAPASIPSEPAASTTPQTSSFGSGKADGY
jgi:hypothetical protein